MDYFAESIALGLDSLILAACIRQYYKSKSSMQLIQGAPYLEINGDLPELVRSHPQGKLDFVSIRGVVRPLGNPIKSNNNRDIDGVVQLLRIKEHVIQRSTTGFWSDSERTIHEVHNFMPFLLKNGSHHVEIVDPLSADVLDMDVIHDEFKPTVPTVMDHIWGFFAGVRQRGVQSTEKMLRVDTRLTGIGELAATEDGGVRLQPPSNGGPFYLTNMQVTSLVNRLKVTRRNYLYLCLLFGTLGAVFIGLIARKYYLNGKKQAEEEKRRKLIEENRQRRRKENRERTNSEGSLCVVCKTNPLEIILLPCGHVCLCEDCQGSIRDVCPICRAAIEAKSVAFVS